MPKSTSFHAAFLFSVHPVEDSGGARSYPSCESLAKRQVTGLILAENANPLRGSMSKSIQCNTLANRTCTVTCCDNSL